METAVARSRGQYAEVNGLNMYYEIHGEGSPLVLIHGGGSTIGTTFGRILPTLAKSHRVIAVELQAHGHTADIDRPLSFQQDADDVVELLRQLDVPKADIFGFSNGASTTLELAIRHPQMVGRIIVASTMYNKAGAIAGFWDMMANPSFDQMPLALKEAYLEINPDKDALHRMYSRDVARMQAFPEISESDIRKIKAPTLILCGNHDVVTLDHALQMHREIEHSQLAVFPGGHGDYLGEITTLKPGQQTFTGLAVIEEFLKG